LAYTVRFHPDAVADLQQMARTDANAHARIIAFMREFLTDASFLQSLAVPGFRNELVNDVVCLDQWQRQGFELWRIKVMGFDTRPGRLRGYWNHRFVYAFDDAKEIIWFLGIFHRNDFNYDPKEPNGVRVAAAYQSLRLPIVTIH
jgi:mRNA-degrading endonuclease RelE of RelBE toxin-antitoxin system